MSAKILLSGCALLVLGITPAAAGQCTTEIQNLSMIMGTSDAGSGPTGRSSSSEHPPTTAMKQADPSTSASSSAAGADKPQHPPTATMNSAATGTTGMSPSTDQKTQDQHPPTATMNQATGGSAASPQDVQRQTQGAPTASSQAQGSAGSDAGGKMAAMTALDQARALDRDGKEAECMAAIRQAQQHMAR